MKTDDEIMREHTNADDGIAKIIYENIFMRDKTGKYRDWTTAQYQAPETYEGFALRLSCHVSELIRGIEK